MACPVSSVRLGLAAVLPSVTNSPDPMSHGSHSSRAPWICASNIVSTSLRASRKTARAGDKGVDLAYVGCAGSSPGRSAHRSPSHCLDQPPPPPLPFSSHCTNPPKPAYIYWCWSSSGVGRPADICVLPPPPISESAQMYLTALS